MHSLIQTGLRMQRMNILQSGITVIDMGLISEAEDDKSFRGKIPQLLLSSVGSSTAVYLYTPEKSQTQSQFLASILSV